jgi:23S rRNA (uridine2552-2'-O)-methyltransferase
LVVKAFQGSGLAELQGALRAKFDKVYTRKPKASRDRSREVYLVGKGLGSALSRETGPARG